MRILLDTHVLIWWDSGARLSAQASRAIREADEVHVSAVSAWELAIKTALGKVVSQRTLSTVIDDNGFLELPVLVRHAEVLNTLPTHHRDPFDRLLVAQASAERLTLLTRDTQLLAYPIRTIRA
jgi:PIN domain nuclease of toxin-antitoxin system